RTRTRAVRRRRTAVRRLEPDPAGDGQLRHPRPRLPVPARPGELDRGRHLGDPAEHHCRAGAGPAGRTPHGHPRALEGPAPMTATDAGRTAGRIPDLRYQEAENDLRAAVRDLLDDRCPWPSVLARTETDEPNDAAAWRSLATELGCAGLLIPESYGGAGAADPGAGGVAGGNRRAGCPAPHLRPPRAAPP